MGYVCFSCAPFWQFMGINLWFFFSQVHAAPLQVSLVSKQLVCVLVSLSGTCCSFASCLSSKQMVCVLVSLSSAWCSLIWWPVFCKGKVLPFRSMLMQLLKFFNAFGFRFGAQYYKVINPHCGNSLSVCSHYCTFIYVIELTKHINQNR